MVVKLSFVLNAYSAMPFLFILQGELECIFSFLVISLG